MNVKRESSVYSCKNTSCKNIFRFAKNVIQKDIILFENVREILFRPHTSYERSIDDQLVSQRVVFMELCEENNSIKNSFHVLDHLIDVENGHSSTQPSTSISANKPVIRVCAFASESLFGVDQVLLQKNAIQQNDSTGARVGSEASLWRADPNNVNLIQQNDANSTEKSLSTIEQLLTACFCVDGNHTCSQHREISTFEFVSIDFEDLVNENFSPFK